MLVLTRKPGEKIVASLGGETLIIKVVDSSRHKVRLSFEANPVIVIDREEVHERKLADQEIVARSGAFSTDAQEGE